MKYFISITLISLLSFLLFSTLPTNYEKQIKREIRKVFGKKKEISFEKIEIPDSLKLNKHNLLFNLKIQDSVIGLLSFNKVNACRIGGCTKPNPLNEGRYDHFYYIIIFDANFSILRVRVLDYQSDYGYEICSKGWLKQFTGHSDSELIYGDEIDAISGATVSGDAIVNDINKMCKLIKELKKITNN